MPTLVTRVELIDLIGLWAPQPLGTCEISDGPQPTKSVQFGKKIPHFSMGVNVWQYNKYMINAQTKLGSIPQFYTPTV